MEGGHCELHKEGGRLGILQEKDISVSYTKKRGNCNGKRSA